MLISEMNIIFLTKVFNILLFLNLISFVFYFYDTIYPVYGMGFNFMQSLLVTLLIINLFFVFFIIQKEIHHLGLILFPLTSATLIMSQFMDNISVNQEYITDGLQLHILTSFSSYGFLGLAAIQALLLNYQEKQLKNVKHSQFIASLPSIEVMEKIMFDLIILGFILLTISLLSGAPFVIQDNSIHIIQKILFSLIAWITFAYLLYKRFSYGVRGKKAVHITLSGIIFLLIAYLGTKFLFEALSV
tara:strand:- start:3170 stop:3904 length:735 start_codon:yes stop_codon:yes gene_type:complete